MALDGSRLRWALVAGLLNAILVGAFAWLVSPKVSGGHALLLALGLWPLCALGAWLIHPPLRAAAPVSRLLLRGAGAGALAGIVVAAALVGDPAYARALPPPERLAQTLGASAVGALFAAPIGALVGVVLALVDMGLYEAFLEKER